jgi:hypothetical protein
MVKNCDIFFFGKKIHPKVSGQKVSQWRSNATNNQNKMGGREEDVKEGRGGRKKGLRNVRKKKETEKERFKRQRGRGDRRKAEKERLKREGKIRIRKKRKS